MSNVFCPGLLTPDQIIKVMGEKYWPVLVTLNAGYDLQVAFYQEAYDGRGKHVSGVGMVNSVGMAALNVQYGAMKSKKNHFQGDGVSIINLGNETLVKSKSATYVNRAINNSADLKSFLEFLRDKKDYFDEVAHGAVESYKQANRHGRRYLSCNRDQDAVLLKYALQVLEGAEPLNAAEHMNLVDLLRQYKHEVVNPNKAFMEEYNSFFSRGRCVLLHITEFNKEFAYAVGVVDPNAYLNMLNKTANWISPVKLYKSLDDITDEELKAAIYSRLVMIKLRHKEKIGEYFDAVQTVPIFETDTADGLVISRALYGDRRGRSAMLINLG